MKSQGKSFHGKIMLFGEYSIICGSEALVIPFKKLSGSWIFSPEENIQSDHTQKSGSQLFDFLDYLKSKPELSTILNLQSFEKDIQNGLIFQSSIPQQYGVGSSGALVAATYDRYKINDEPDIFELKQKLALIESAFHGNSSGIDPLCCYLNEAIYMDQNGIPAPIKLSVDDSSSSNFYVFLIDTHISSSTGNLVSHFRAMMHQYSFYKKLSQAYIPTLNLAIADFLNQHYDQLMHQLAELSSLQTELFPKMIPKSYEFLFQQDSNKVFQIKICGSGGGGYLLGFTQFPEETKSFLHKNNLDYLFL